MQTFLPYRSFRDSAKVLDRQRLGKQRVETLQIMTALLEDRGWVNHPATLMWRGHELYLLMYQEAVCEEWVRRGYHDTCLEKTKEIYFNHPEKTSDDEPWWLGLYDLHASHRSNLVSKDPVHYRPIFPLIEIDLEYFWPSRVESVMWTQKSDLAGINTESQWHARVLYEQTARDVRWVPR